MPSVRKLTPQIRSMRRIIDASAYLCRQVPETSSVRQCWRRTLPPPPVRGSLIAMISTDRTCRSGYAPCRFAQVPTVNLNRLDHPRIASQQIASQLLTLRPECGRIVPGKQLSQQCQTLIFKSAGLGPPAFIDLLLHLIGQRENSIHLIHRCAVITR